MVNSRQCVLLHNDRLERQLCLLERRVMGASGRERVDHPRGSHDDLANAAAGALVMARQRGAPLPAYRLQPFAINASDPLASPEENMRANARAEARAGRWSGPGWAPRWIGPDDGLQQTHGID